ncbi:MAG: FecR domain-containing protein [Gemmataceae bacterium]
MAEKDWATIIQCHLDGIASSEEVASLSEHLESDAELRKLYLKMARIHATLASEYFEESILEKVTERNIRPEESVGFSGRSKSPGVRSRLTWVVFAGMATAMAALVVGGIYLLKDRKPKSKPEIMKVTELEGNVRWTGDNGEVCLDIVSGEYLTGGSLELLSPDSSVVLQFGDGSTVAIAGEADLTISQLSQRELHLWRGNLSAHVQAQPEDKPMLVHTPAAELEVLGTQFDVMSDYSTTKVIVSEGRVRVKRVTDGSVLEVPAANQTVVSIEAEEKLVAVRVKKPTHSWHPNLKKDHNYGTWVSASYALRIRLGELVRSGKISQEQAVDRFLAANFSEDEGSLYGQPMRMGTPRPGHNPMIAYLISLAVSEREPCSVVLAKGNTFRIQGKLERPAVVVFGLSTLDTKNGKGTRHVTRRSLPAGVFDIQLPVEEFQGRRDRNQGPSPLGRKVLKWWCFTENREAKLSIMDVDLMAPNEN